MPSLSPTARSEPRTLSMFMCIVTACFPRPLPVTHPQQVAQPGLHFAEVELPLCLNAHGGHAGGVGVLRVLLRRSWVQEAWCEIGQC